MSGQSKAKRVLSVKRIIVIVILFSILFGGLKTVLRFSQGVYMDDIWNFRSNKIWYDRIANMLMEIYDGEKEKYSNLSYIYLGAENDTNWTVECVVNDDIHDKYSYEISLTVSAEMCEAMKRIAERLYFDYHGEVGSIVTVSKQWVAFDSNGFAFVRTRDMNMPPHNTYKMRKITYSEMISFGWFLIAN